MKKKIKIGLRFTKVSNQPKNYKTYAAMFLQNNTMQGKGDKVIYIRAEYHERILRIAQTIGDGKIPMYAYLDNILKHHFDEFQQQIEGEFVQKNKPIF